MRKLNDICNVITCGVAKRPEYYDDGIPFLSSKNVKSDRFLLNDYKYVSKEDFLSLTKNNKPEKGDILYTRVGSFGEAAVIDFDFDFAIFVSLTLIKPKNDIVLSRYLMHYLNSPKIKHLAKNSTSGVGVQNLNVKVVREFPIQLPPLDQQKKIATILDAADAYRQKTKALIEKYDALTQSLFLEMFGDPFTNKKKFPVFKLGELCNELFLGLTSKVEYVEKGGFPLVRAKDINKGILSFEKVKYISEKQHRKITARRITKRGDVLISKSGTLGTCAIVDSDREFTTYESIFTVRPKEGLLSNIFLVYLVRNEGFKLKLLGNKVGGTVAHLNLKMFRDFEFPLPNIQKQKKFTKRAQAIEAQKAQAQASLAQAEDLFNSLLQRAFKGELV